MNSKFSFDIALKRKIFFKNIYEIPCWFDVTQVSIENVNWYQNIFITNKNKAKIIEFLSKQEKLIKWIINFLFVCRWGRYRCRISWETYKVTSSDSSHITPIYSNSYVSFESKSSQVRKLRVSARLPACMCDGTSLSMNVHFWFSVLASIHYRMW